jgi:uncharacterized DUF497 family protein
MNAEERAVANHRLHLAGTLCREAGLEARRKSEEVEAIFASNPHYRFVEKGHVPSENMYAAMGQTEAGRYLVAFFIHKLDGRALIISAREMDAAEKKRYGRK